MSAERRRKNNRFLYTKEIIVWTLLLAFFAGLLIYNKDRILGKEKEAAETQESESDSGMFDGDWVDDTDEAQSDEPETEPPETGPTLEELESLTVPPDNGLLAVYFLDVGEGDAAILTLNSHVMLIDGGNEEHASLLVSWLQRLGIGQVDYMIASHPHKDHVGGLPSVYETASVGRIYTPVTEYAENATFGQLMQLAAERGTEVKVPAAGESFDFQGAEVTFIGPIRYDTEEMNNNSLVVRVRYGTQTFLFTGDAEAEEEADMLLSGYNLKANVLKVSHHGSEYASTDVFARAVQAEACIISVGENEYKHPSADVMQRLTDAGGTVYETWISGTITATTDGYTLNLNFER